MYGIGNSVHGCNGGVSRPGNVLDPSFCDSDTETELIAFIVKKSLVLRCPSSLPTNDMN